MNEKKRDSEVITLGSGDLMIQEYAGTMPEYTDFKVDTDLLGRIQGGATLEYKGEWYEAKDDTGKVVKTIITEEEATLKSGIITWNGKTLEKLCSTARVTEQNGIRTVKIGGVGNHNGKSYALCFHHTDGSSYEPLIRAVSLSLSLRIRKPLSMLSLSACLRTTRVL